MIARNKRGAGGFLKSSNASHVYDIGETNTVAVDFNKGDMQTVTVDGNNASGVVTLSAVNDSPGDCVSVEILCENLEADLSFPAAWVWVTSEPANVYADKRYILSLSKYFSGHIMAAWAYEG